MGPQQGDPLGPLLFFLPQAALILLRASFGAAKLTFLLRTAPCYAHPALGRMDDEIRGGLENLLNVSLNDIPRTGHVSAYMLDVLHWLPLQQRIMFRIGAMVWGCILGLAPAYLRNLCHPTPGTRGCCSLRSSEQRLLFVPFARTTTTQARAFSVVGPSVWNGLPLSQRLLPRILSDTFYSSLKTLL